VSVHLAAETAAEVLPGAITFVVIGMGAFLLPLIARQIRVPAVVLEILYGLLIGPAALGIIGSETVAEGFLLVLAELGLLLLMFLAGFEIDFAKLEREGARPIVFGMIFY
jgi:Kef-type K+ transport system membrane component KefB